MAECSFKPKTLKYKHGASRQETSGDKCFDLYSKVPVGSIAAKTSKTSDDQVYEMFKEDCYFKPKINKGIKTGGALSGVRGLETTLDRMNKGREMHNTKKMWTERGMISQKLKGVDKSEMVFTSKPSKFNSAFGKEGSQMSPERVQKQLHGKNRRAEEREVEVESPE